MSVVLVIDGLITAAQILGVTAVAVKTVKTVVDVGKDTHDSAFSNVPEVRYEAMKKRNEELEANHRNRKMEMDDYQAKYDRTTRNDEMEMDERIKKKKESNLEMIRKTRERMKEIDREHTVRMGNMKKDQDRRMYEMWDRSVAEKMQLKKECEEKQQKVNREFNNQRIMLDNQLAMILADGKKRINELGAKKEEVVQARRQAIDLHAAAMKKTDRDYFEESRKSIRTLGEKQMRNFKEDRKATENFANFKQEKWEEANRMLKKSVQNDNNREMMNKFLKLIVEPLKKIQQQVQQLGRLGHEVTGHEMIQVGKVDPYCSELQRLTQVFYGFDDTFTNYLNNNQNIDTDLRSLIIKHFLAVREFRQNEDLNFVIPAFPKAIDTNDWGRQKLCLAKVKELEWKCSRLDTEISQNLFESRQSIM